MLKTINNNANLLPTETKAFQTNVSLPNGVYGNYYIHVQTDVSNQIFENTAENNNISASSLMQISLHPWADLRVDNLTSTDTSIAGSSVAFGFDITNHGIGNVNANESWEDRVYLSTDTAFNGNAVFLNTFQRSQQLNSGASYFQSGSWGCNMKIFDEI